MMTSPIAIIIVAAVAAAVVIFCWLRNRDKHTLDQYYLRGLSRSDDWR